MPWPAVPAEQRFALRIEADPNSGCWLWSGGQNRQGYGVFSTSGDGSSILAHRFAYQERFGPIPSGLSVCHRCDTPACVNPAHLFLGTNAENVADRVRKGRQICGERSYNAKLGAADVLAIRGSTEPHRVLADRYGVELSVISSVRTRRIWRSVP